MKNPLESLSRPKLASFLGLMLVWSIILLLILQYADRPLRTEAAPKGMVSFQFAGSFTKAQIILDSWGGKAGLYAAFSLGFDYLFMLVYSTTLALGCIGSSRVLKEKKWRLQGMGGTLAWGMWGTALVDGIENLALFMLLLENRSVFLAPLAWGAALIKFSAIMTGAAYCIYGASAGLVTRWQNKHRTATFS
jgi:hypothetical protein